MYHIKQDKRSQTSAAQIVQGLQECLKTTPLKAITVSDLHRVTGISRATFYRLFDTPEDVLIYQLDQMTEKSGAAYADRGSMSSAQLLEYTIHQGMQNHEFLKALVENGRLDLLFRYTEHNFRNMTGLGSIFPENMEQREREYVISHLFMGMVSALITWDRNGHRESAKDMLHYVRRYTEILSGILKEDSEGDPDPENGTDCGGKTAAAVL